MVSAELSSPIAKAGTLLMVRGQMSLSPEKILAAAAAFTGCSSSHFGGGAPLGTGQPSIGL